MSATFVNSMRSGIDAPSVLFTSIDTSIFVPVAESAGRLPPMLIVDVVTGADRLTDRDLHRCRHSRWC